MGEDSRSTLTNRIIERAWKDEKFKKELLADPRGTLEKELGRKVPESLNIRVVEETPKELFVVLPVNPNVTPGRELSAEELDQVAGGFGTSWLCSTGTCGDCGA